MRVVVSIGGSVLAPTLDASHVEAYASIIEELVEAGCELAAVVGGGGVARQYIEVARTMDANEVQLDQLGIDVTRINARLLIAALGSIVDPKVAETYEDAGDVFVGAKRDHCICVGGWRADCERMLSVSRRSRRSSRICSAWS